MNARDDEPTGDVGRGARDDEPTGDVGRGAPDDEPTGDRAHDDEPTGDESQQEHSAFDQRLRESGIPHIAVRAARWLPGRLGEDTSGTLRLVRRTRFIGLAAELAYFMTVGLIPLAVAVLALIGLVRPLLGPSAELAIDSTFDFLITFHLRGQTREQALNGIDRLLGGGPVLLFVPLVITTYASVRGFTGAMRGLANLYETEIDRPHWRDALATLGFTGLAAVLGVVTAFGALLASTAGGAVLGVLRWGRWVVIPLGLLAFLTALYRYVHGSPFRWRDELPGAIVATVGMVGAAAAYAAYLESSPDLGLGPFFGPVVGGALATLGLMFGLAALMLLGGAYNAWLAGGGDLNPEK